MSSSELVDNLSVLLRELQLPLILESPADLTPSLLIAILESILSSRLPLSPELRNALSSSGTKDSKNAKIQCMKIFLGVIETDILKRDVGLNRIDPRKLANGNWDEVVYVGEMLIWIARECGIIDEVRAAREIQAWRLTPSTVPETSTSHHSSYHSSSSPTTADTSVSMHDFDNLLSFHAPSTSSRLSPLISPRPLCIHEVRSPFTQDKIGSSVRYSGYIQPVDEDFEISSFEHNRSLGNGSSFKTDKNNSVDECDLIALSELFDPDPQARTVSLLQQRAFLLRELAKYALG